MASLSSLWSWFQCITLFEHASSFSFHDNTPPLPVIRAILHYGNRQQIALLWPLATLFDPRNRNVRNTCATTSSRINIQCFHLGIFQLSISVLNVYEKELLNHQSIHPLSIVFTKITLAMLHYGFNRFKQSLSLWHVWNHHKNHKIMFKIPPQN